MRRSTVPILLAAALTAPLGGQEPGAQADPPLVVHEWGTFTSLQGSDGVVLEGLHHEEEALPEFVHDLGRLAEVGEGNAGLKFPASRVTQKMETPVLYFHTDVPRRVKVSVTFADGLMTQFYPLPELVAPRLAEVERLVAAAPVDLAKIDWSCIEWDVDVIPAGPEVDGIPEVAPEDPWAEARRVHSAFVRTRPDPAAGRPAEAEHYLFYRGLGRFALPLRAVSDEDGTVLHNEGEHVIPFAVAVEVTADGRGRFRPLGALPAGGATATTLDGVRWRDGRGLVGGLHVALQTALLEQGLHDDEARAMVATWSRQWFLSPGRRVLWVVPRPLVDRNLRLRIEPEPTELVRVLVGRLEVLTPGVEERVERALIGRRAEDPAERRRAEATLVALDRFLEPHVRRAFARSDSPAVRESAAEVLAALGSR